MKYKIVVAAIALIAAFLVGYVPQYVTVNRLQDELRQSRRENAGAEIKELIGMAYVQANQKNCRLAAETISRFFNRVREVASQSQDASHRKALTDLLALRDKITAELAKGDAAVMGDLQQLFDHTLQATRRADQS